MEQTNVFFEHFCKTDPQLNQLSLTQIDAVINLKNDGASIPFIARYRKDKTKGMKDIEIINLLERYEEFLNFVNRKKLILENIEKLQKLTPDLKAKIEQTFDPVLLEDLYLPYKPKKITKAAAAKEKGLETLAKIILGQGFESTAAIQNFINKEKGIETEEVALEGAKDIVIEHINEITELRKKLRDICFQEGFIKVEKFKPNEKNERKFADYFNYKEKISELKVPQNSHRFLAILRGVEEKALKITLMVDDVKCLNLIREYVKIKEKSPWAPHLRDAVTAAWENYLSVGIFNDIKRELKNISDEAAINVFEKNLRQILLSSPFGNKPVLALDPGFKSGVKMAAIGNTGDVLETETIFPNEPQNQWQEGAAKLFVLIKKHDIKCIVVGDGTASKETVKFCKQVIGKACEENLLTEKIPVCLGSEAGASIYSASDIARFELPDLDVSLRGAVSIARRFQDPLAELVKIDPKSIGVGQYQHDVHQAKLKKRLEQIVENVVNYVGVDINLASFSLLTCVSGIGPGLARAIVDHRKASGPFQSRKDLYNVPKFSDKAFQQAAGFLRVPSSSEPFDNSSIHPEAYDLVKNILSQANVTLESARSNPNSLSQINLSQYYTEDMGEFYFNDLKSEIVKPTRDPREELNLVEFSDAVNSIEELQVDMELNGVVTNITNFGAFVDIGVGQVGLVHLSEMSDKFVKSPAEVVTIGQQVKVRVKEVDVTNKRISLSMKPKHVPQPRAPRPQNQKFDKPRDNRDNRDRKNFKQNNDRKPQDDRRKSKESRMFNSGLSDALSKLKIGPK